MTTDTPVPDTSWRTSLALAAASAGVAAASLAVGEWALVAGAVGGLATLGQSAVTGRSHADDLTSWVRSQVALTSAVPPLEAVAAAVADGLAAAGLTSVGASALAVDVHPGGEYRFRLVGTEDDAEVFATAFDEAIGPVGAPRYLVSRYTDAQLPDRPIRTRRGARSALLAARATGEAWHPVPTVLGRNATNAGHYLARLAQVGRRGPPVRRGEAGGRWHRRRGLRRGPVCSDHGHAAPLVLTSRGGREDAHILTPEEDRAGAPRTSMRAPVVRQSSAPARRAGGRARRRTHRPPAGWRTSSRRRP